MKANIVIKANESFITFTDVEIMNVMTYAVSFNVKSVMKEEVNQLYNSGANIAFCDNFVHICVDRENIEELNFL